jgi:hypothetical protein
MSNEKERTKAKWYIKEKGDLPTDKFYSELNFKNIMDPISKKS